MKTDFRIHILRLNLLLLLFLGWGTGSAVAETGLKSADATYLDNFVTVLGSNPTKPAALASDLADPAVGPALLDFLSDNTSGITTAIRLNRLKAWEGLFDWELFRKNPIDLETVSNYYTRTGKTADDFADELFTDQALIRSWLDDQAANIYRFTFKQIDDYVAFATKQGNQSKVMLGMWDGGGSSSYIAKAGTDHTYFDMGSKWDEAVSLVDGGVNDHFDEMWEINKKFLQNEKAGGKEFWFSHDPYSPGNEQFFAREVNWLIDEGVQDFIEVGDLWKAVW